jgi:hypothetical protein
VAAVSCRDSILVLTGLSVEVHFCAKGPAARPILRKRRRDMAKGKKLVKATKLEKKQTLKTPFK